MKHIFLFFIFYLFQNQKIIKKQIVFIIKNWFLRILLKALFKLFFPILPVSKLFSELISMILFEDRFFYTNFHLNFYISTFIGRFVINFYIVLIFKLVSIQVTLNILPFSKLNRAIQEDLDMLKCQIMKLSITLCKQQFFISSNRSDFVNIFAYYEFDIIFSITKNLMDLNIDLRNCSFQRNRKLSSFSQSTQSTDDQNNSQRQNFHFHEKDKNYVQKNLKKYKTQLCKNFSENGACPYRRKCKFAHGLNELHDCKKQQGKHYRTKKCTSFWNQGACPYGRRCQFQHLKLNQETTQLLTSWKIAIQIQTNQSGFVGSKLLRLLRIE